MSDQINNRPTVPSYTPDELDSRIADGSIDVQRLAATVARMLTQLTIVVTWANAQIEAQRQSSERITAEPATATATKKR